MKSEERKTSRRDLFRNIAQGIGLMGIGGIAWTGYVKEVKASELVLRPPGAISEKDFIKACVKCGVCVEACPYDTLQLSTLSDDKPTGTPFFEPRIIPCYMCPDIPCVPVCPSGALDINKLTGEDDPTQMNVNLSKMGVAVVDKESCLAFWGIQCDACYRACPLMGEAITLEQKRNERTGKHAFIEPVVKTEICTGCGLCEHACVTEKAAIFVLPLEIATGKVGSHYIKSWEKEDENRINQAQDIEIKEDSKAIENYLNDMDDLLED